jgi:peptidoglycan/xylan/chitin deacetylase (PgdA/CDA1 family)
VKAISLLAWTVIIAPLITACAAGGSGGARIIASTDEFLIVQAGASETPESLAVRFLGDASSAAVITEANGGVGFGAGQFLTIPLKPLNAAGVYVDGYQVIPILCYHQFGEGENTSHRMEVSERNFDRQVTYLVNNGYQVITLSDLENFLAGTKAIPKKAVVITIDDGFRSAYSVAFPVLKKYNIPATIYLYTDFVGGAAALTWDQIKSMQQSGLIDFQSHSKSHPSLAPGHEDGFKSDYLKRVTSELKAPKIIIRNRLGGTSRHFAYPFGDTAEEVLDLLRAEGYQTAVTVQRGGNPAFAHPLLLKRNMIYGDDDLNRFKKQVRVFRKANLK